MLTIISSFRTEHKNTRNLEWAPTSVVTLLGSYTSSRNLDIVSYANQLHLPGLLLVSLKRLRNEDMSESFFFFSSATDVLTLRQESKTTANETTTVMSERARTQKLTSDCLRSTSRRHARRSWTCDQGVLDSTRPAGPRTVAKTRERVLLTTPPFWSEKRFVFEYCATGRDVSFYPAQVTRQTSSAHVRPGIRNVFHRNRTAD